MKNKIKILLAEDEISLAQIIKESMETRGFEVFHCKDGIETMNCYHNECPDIVVLDIMMPKKDGFTAAREIRMIDSQIPIIFLTAKSQTKDVVEGFSLGGNDYLKKPFSIEELIVRIENLLERNTNIAEEKPIKIGDYIFQFKKQILQYRSEEPKILTHREAHLLFHLYKNKNEVLDRSVILKKLWGNDDFFSARSMDVFISKLRKKLAGDKNIQILNIRGFGYKLAF